MVLALEQRHRWGLAGRQRAWLARALQVPVVVLRPGRAPDLTELFTRVLELASSGRTASPGPAYQPAFAQALATLTAAIAAPGLAGAFPPRWLALKLLQDPTGFWPEISTHPGLEGVQGALLSARRAMEFVPGQGCEAWLTALN